MEPKELIKAVARDSGITEQQAEICLTTFCDFLHKYETDQEGVDITKLFPKYKYFEEEDEA